MIIYKIEFVYSPHSTNQTHAEFQTRKKSTTQLIYCMLKMMIWFASWSWWSRGAEEIIANSWRKSSNSSQIKKYLRQMPKWDEPHTLQMFKLIDLHLQTDTGR